MLMNFAVILVVLGCRAADGAPPNFEAEMLSEHNAVREAHGVQLLKLDTELSASATEAAKSKLNEYLANHTVSHPTVTEGEKFFSDNIWAVQSTTPTVAHPRRIVGRWADEEKLHDWSKNEFDIHTGHFTQLIWNASTHVGFGYAQGEMKSKDFVTLVIARYSPPGNVVDKKHFADNVFPRQNIIPHLELLNQDAASLKKIIANLTLHVEKLAQEKGRSASEAPVTAAANANAETTFESRKPVEILGAGKAGSRSVGKGEEIQSVPRVTPSREKIGLLLTSTEPGKPMETTIAPTEVVTSSAIYPGLGRPAAANVTEPGIIAVPVATTVKSTFTMEKTDKAPVELPLTTPQLNQDVKLDGESGNRTIGINQSSPDIAKSGRAGVAIELESTTAPQIGRDAAPAAKAEATNNSSAAGSYTASRIDKVISSNPGISVVDFNAELGNTNLITAFNTTVAKPNESSQKIIVLENLTLMGNKTDEALDSLPKYIAMSANTTLPNARSVVPVMVEKNSETPALPSVVTTAQPDPSREMNVKSGNESNGIAATGNPAVTPSGREPAPFLDANVLVNPGNGPVGVMPVIKPDQLTRMIEKPENITLVVNGSMDATTPDRSVQTTTTSGNETREIVANLTVTPIGRSTAAALSIDSETAVNVGSGPVVKMPSIRLEKFPETTDKSTNTGASINATNPDLPLQTNVTTGNETLRIGGNLTVSPIGTISAPSLSEDANVVVNPGIQSNVNAVQPEESLKIEAKFGKAVIATVDTTAPENITQASLKGMAEITQSLDNKKLGGGSKKTTPEDATEVTSGGGEMIVNSTGNPEQNITTTAKPGETGVIPSTTSKPLQLAPTTSDRSNPSTTELSEKDGRPAGRIATPVDKMVSPNSTTVEPQQSQDILAVIPGNWTTTNPITSKSNESALNMRKSGNVSVSSGRGSAIMNLETTENPANTTVSPVMTNSTINNTDVIRKTESVELKAGSPSMGNSSLDEPVAQGLATEGSVVAVDDSVGKNPKLKKNKLHGLTEPTTRLVIGHQKSDVGFEAIGRGVLAHDPKLMHGVSHAIIQAQDNSSSASNDTEGGGNLIASTKPPGSESRSEGAQTNDTLAVTQKESETKSKESIETKGRTEPVETNPVEPKMEGPPAVSLDALDNTTRKPGKRSIAEYYGKPIAVAMNALTKDVVKQTHVRFA